MPSPVRQAVGRQALSDRPTVRQAVGAVGCRPQACRNLSGGRPDHQDHQGRGISWAHLV